MMLCWKIFDLSCLNFNFIQVFLIEPYEAVICVVKKKIRLHKETHTRIIEYVLKLNL